MTPESSSLGPIAAFLAGMVSFLSPCVLPLVPGYVSFIAGTSMRESATASGKRWTPLLLALVFVLGFATVFIALGATASVISDLLLQYRREEAIVGGLVIMLFGMLMLGFQGFGRVQRDVRWHRDWPGGQPFLAFGPGLAFGFGWTPCIGPVLGAILTLSAVTGVSDGVALHTVYSAGLGVPFLLAAAFTGRMLQHQQALRRLSRPLQAAGGIVLVAMGAAMVTILYRFFKSEVQFGIEKGLP